MPSYHSPDRLAAEDEAVDRLVSGAHAAADTTATLQAYETPGAPDPIRWEPQLPLGRRIRRAVTVPALAGAVAFAIAVVIAIVLVWVRPHDPAASEPFDGAAAGQTLDAGSEDDGAGDGANADPAEGGDGPRGGSDGVTDEVFVHVVGEVDSPGVVTLPGDARVEAALEAAGGVTEGAVLDGVNLARQVVDGEQIVVPDKKLAAEMAAGAAPGGAGTDASGGAAPGVAAEGLVNLNTADASDLETLPRVGPALSARIIEWREANDGFASVDQLLEVSGIGAKTLEGFRDRVTV